MNSQYSVEQLESIIPVQEQLAKDVHQAIFQRLEPIKHTLGIDYFGFCFMNVPDNYCGGTTNDIELVKIFSQIKNYGLGAMRMRKNVIYDIKHILNKKTFEQVCKLGMRNTRFYLLRNDKHIELFTIGIHDSASNESTTRKIDQQSLFHYARSFLFENCSDLIEQLQQDPTPFPTKSEAGKYFLNYFCDLMAKRNSKKAMQARALNSIENAGELVMLTPRERDCLNLLIAQKTNEEISDVLGVTPKRLQKIINRLQKKSGCLNRDQLYQVINQNGLIRTF